MRACSQYALRFLLLTLTLCIFANSSLWARKNAAIVICAQTGKVFHSHNADVCAHPASLTKMMTLYMAFKALREQRLFLNQKLLVSKHAARQAPSKLWLKAGTTISVKDAILACATKSANDAAVVLAEAIGKGSETRFSNLMTQEARQLGMTKTSFYNASGLPNKQHPNITTARDMAVLSQALYKHFPEQCKIFSQKQFVYKGQVYGNHNKLLGVVPGVNGIKTGFTNAAGFNLAASMKRNNKHFIAVVLGGETSRSRDRKMTHLLESTFKKMNRGGSPTGESEWGSIDELIYALAQTEAESFSSPEPKLRKVVHQSNRVKVQSASIHDLIDTIETSSQRPKLIKASLSSKTKTKTKTAKPHKKRKKK